MELSRPLATITPTLDGDVLTVLARHDATFTTGQVHRILVQPSEEGIRKVLRRLTGQGIVLSERVGNAFAYRFNRDHLAAQYIVGLARMQETFLARLEDLLESWRIPPVYAAVFGSAARGQMTTSSDVDLLLVRPRAAAEPDWEGQVNDLATTVTRWLGNDTRVLEFAEDEIVMRGREEPVLNDVLQEGLTVAGRRSWLAKQLRSGKN
ncbi:MAG: nucleotidyltransferase domain-containing protein [Actinophytocola sp.]|uniref:nucleotidyltransferase domain-containing protein n=1 Tax=Actinophytocola sp. TaxID=1872138 RepID=UPI003C768F21